MAIAYLGLGSNLGDREKNILDSIEHLIASDIFILKTSSIRETEPVGGPPQALFLNAAIEIRTSLSPHDLLKLCQKIELKLGRVRNIPNGPRTIDIDLLIYDNMKLSSSELTIPHPRIFERTFVMDPLNEIDPNILIQLKNDHI